MKINNYLKIFSVLGLLATADIAQAKDFNFDSAIDILRALNVRETQKMDFGVIEEPTSDVKVHITKEGAVGEDNNATHIDTSTIAAGKYKILGSDLSSISISARDGGSVNGMEFEELNASYGDNSADLINGTLSGLDQPGAAGTDLIIGGLLKVKGGVTEGTYAPDFILEVNYE